MTIFTKKIHRYNIDPDPMEGSKFGKWKVIKKIKHKPDHRYYQCRCECGTEKIIGGWMLRRGDTKRCIKCRYKPQSDNTTAYVFIAGINEYSQ